MIWWGVSLSMTFSRMSSSITSGTASGTPTVTGQAPEATLKMTDMPDGGPCAISTDAAHRGNRSYTFSTIGSTPSKSSAWYLAERLAERTRIASIPADCAPSTSAVRLSPIIQTRFG